MKKKISVEAGMYLCGLIALVVGLPCLLLYLSMVDTGIYPPCVLYSILGVYCPGCGGTRAVMALLDGKIFKSLYYHPVVLYGVVIYIVFMVSRTLHYCSRGKIKGIQFHAWFLYVALFIIVVNCIVKNLLKFGFGIQVF